MDCAGFSGICNVETRPSPDWCLSVWSGDYFPATSAGIWCADTGTDSVNVALPGYDTRIGADFEERFAREAERTSLPGSDIPFQHLIDFIFNNRRSSGIT